MMKVIPICQLADAGNIEICLQNKGGVEGAVVCSQMKLLRCVSGLTFLNILHFKKHT